MKRIEEIRSKRQDLHIKNRSVVTIIKHDELKFLKAGIYIILFFLQMIYLPVQQGRMATNNM